MKKLSYVLAVIGVAIFVYACIFRFVDQPTVFGYIHAVQARTAVIGANSILLMAALAYLYAKK
jgi:hypothetical protein